MNFEYKDLPRHVKDAIAKAVLKRLKKIYDSDDKFSMCFWKQEIEKVINLMITTNVIKQKINFYETSYRSIFDIIFLDMKKIERLGEKKRYLYFLK